MFCHHYTIKSMVVNTNFWIFLEKSWELPCLIIGNFAVTPFCPFCWCFLGVKRYLVFHNSLVLPNLWFSVFSPLCPSSPVFQWIIGNSDNVFAVTPSLYHKIEDCQEKNWKVFCFLRYNFLAYSPIISFIVELSNENLVFSGKSWGIDKYLSTKYQSSRPPSPEGSPPLAACCVSPSFVIILLYHIWWEMQEKNRKFQEIKVWKNLRKGLVISWKYGRIR